MNHLRKNTKNLSKKAQLNPHISVDCVIFGFDYESLNVITIKRSAGSETTTSRTALPGDLIYDDEDLDAAAKRILWELTGLDNIFMEQVGAFGHPERVRTKQDQKWLKSVRNKPEARVVTIAYYSLLPIDKCNFKASSFATSVQWQPISEIDELAFDHLDILKDSLQKLKEKIATHPVGFNLLPEKFTLGQLQKLYEEILNKPIDKRNFRRKILKLGILTQLDEKQIGVAHKPSRYLKFNEKEYNKLSKTGFDNFSF